MKVESSDIVQDAALQFLKYGPRFILSDEEKFRALLVRIVENVLRDKHDWFSARRRAIAGSGLGDSRVAVASRFNSLGCCGLLALRPGCRSDPPGPPGLG